LAYQKRANDPGRRFDEDKADAIVGQLSEQWKAASKGKDIDPAVGDSLSDIATEIARTSDMTSARAAKVAIQALKEGAKVNRDGSVQIGNQPPVFMSQRSILELARLRGANVTSPGIGGVARTAEERGSSPTGNVSHGASDRAPMGVRLPENRPTDDELPTAFRGRPRFPGVEARIPAIPTIDKDYDRDTKRKRAEERNTRRGRYIQGVDTW
jgi:hypothetical protein